jgi:hypothetical protein
VRALRRAALATLASGSAGHGFACLRAGAALTPLCRPCAPVPFSMAAASATAWVYSAGRRSFSVSVPVAGIHARNLKALIAATPDAAELGFAASAWGVFPASPEGAKREGAAELGDLALITPTGGGEVNVWVERVVAPAAGETWGPW